MSDPPMNPQSPFPPSSSPPATIPPYIFGASAIGQLHVQSGLPCQDAYAYEVLPNGWGVIAVADGLGSAGKSDLGALTAVKAAVWAVKAIIAPEAIGEDEITWSGEESWSFSGVVLRALSFARKELEAKAVAEQCNLSDLACTIIIVIFYYDTITVAHIGDGAVVGRKDGVLRLISGPGESEYVNEVVPLTSTEWADAIRISTETTGIECLAVFTDGCQRAGLRKMPTEGILPNRLEPFDRFFRPIFSYAHEVDDTESGNQDIHELLTSSKVCDNSEDDKTLVISVLKSGTWAP